MERNIIVYDLFTHWCATSRVIAPCIDQLSQEYPNVKFIKLNLEKDNPGHPPFNNVRSVPCLIVMVDGVEVSKQFGFKSKIQIKEMFEQYL